MEEKVFLEKYAKYLESKMCLHDEETSDDKLDKIPLVYIEKYLRKKKLKNINNNEV